MHPRKSPRFYLSHGLFERSGQLAEDSFNGVFHEGFGFFEATAHHCFGHVGGHASDILNRHGWRHDQLIAIGVHIQQTGIGVNSRLEARLNDANQLVGRIFVHGRPQLEHGAAGLGIA